MPYQIGLWGQHLVINAPQRWSLRAAVQYSGACHCLPSTIDISCSAAESALPWRRYLQEIDRSTVRKLSFDTQEPAAFCGCCSLCTNVSLHSFSSVV